MRSSKPSKPHPLKRINWREVSTNSEISSRFAIEVYNRFSTLFNENLSRDNIELAYLSLIKATEAVALESLPKKEKNKVLDVSDCPSVCTAKENLKLPLLSTTQLQLADGKEILIVQMQN